MVAPPPTAAPSTAPINGFLKFINASIQVSNGSSYSAPPSPIMLLRSTPEEKVLDEPVTITE